MKNKKVKRGQVRDECTKRQRKYRHHFSRNLPYWTAFIRDTSVQCSELPGVRKIRYRFFQLRFQISIKEFSATILAKQCWNPSEFNLLLQKLAKKHNRPTTAKIAMALETWPRATVSKSQFHQTSHQFSILHLLKWSNEACRPILNNFCQRNKKLGATTFIK